MNAELAVGDIVKKGLAGRLQIWAAADDVEDMGMVLSEGACAPS
jgi:hypothetical protein